MFSLVDNLVSGQKNLFARHLSCVASAGRLVEALPRKAVFYASVMPLVAFYVFFAAVLYPASAHLHPAGFTARLAPLIPIGLRGLLKVRLRPRRSCRCPAMQLPVARAALHMVMA